MIINKQSWHYRLIRALDRWPEDNLCPYCRQVVYAVLSVIGMFLMAGALVLGIGTMLTYPIWQWIFGTEGTFATVSFVMYIILGTCAIKLYREESWRVKSSQHWFWKTAWLHFVIFSMPVREPGPPGLIANYIEAKHAKICPRLEFKEMRDE